MVDLPIRPVWLMKGFSWENVLVYGSKDDLDGLLPRQRLVDAERYSNANYLRQAARVTLEKGITELPKLEERVLAEVKWKKDIPADGKGKPSSPPPRRRGIGIERRDRCYESLGLTSPPIVVSELDSGFIRARNGYTSLIMVCEELKRMSKDREFNPNVIPNVIGSYFRGVYASLEQK